MHEKYDNWFTSLVWSIHTKQMCITFQRNHHSSFSQFESYFEHTVKALDVEMLSVKQIGQGFVIIL